MRQETLDSILDGLSYGPLFPAPGFRAIVAAICNYTTTGWETTPVRSREITVLGWRATHNEQLPYELFVYDGLPRSQTSYKRVDDDSLVVPPLLDLQYVEFLTIVPPTEDFDAEREALEEQTHALCRELEELKVWKAEKATRNGEAA